MSKNKSAKDIAWDKERAKYLKQIRDLEEEVKIWSGECYTYKDMALNLMEENEKLKEALSLNEEDLKLLLDKAKRQEHLNSLFGVMDMVGNRGYAL